MKKTRLHLFTFISVSLVVLLVGLGALGYFYRSAKEALWTSKMEAGKRETRELGRLLEQQLAGGIPAQKVINNLQESILNTDAQSEFICMYNTLGIELCHPNPALIGQKIDAANSQFADSAQRVPFSDVLRSGKASAGIRIFPKDIQRSSEIVSIYPVKGSDWVVAAHANIAVQQAQLENLYHRFILGLLIMVLLIAGSCFLLIRLIYRKYEGIMEGEIDRLSDRVNSLTALNHQLKLSQEKQKRLDATTVALPNDTTPPENSRKRLVTYHKDEMVMVEAEDIAFFSLSENIVSMHTFNEQQYTINSSLDELMKQLDKEVFYRANRQFIINVNAIHTILVYGRNQLRLSTQPQSPENIIISKNKVTDFRKWLDR